MEAILADLFSSDGADYLVAVDRFSGFPFVAPLRRPSTACVTKALKRWFLDWGIPGSIRADSGPCFRQEFNEFCTASDIARETSSAYHPQSNGHAEAAVKSMKHLLQKSASWDEFLVALREWRNTPRQNQPSPAELMFNRKQKTLLPGSGHQKPPDESRTVTSSPGDTLVSSESSKLSVQRQYELLQPGDKVRVQEPHSQRWTQKGTIVSCRDNNRSYYIDLYEEDGDTMEKRILRNRRFLKKL